MNRLLLIEDDEAIGSTLLEGLRYESFNVRWARDGKQGYAELTREIPDVLIVDWMLPEEDGVSLLQRGRAAGIVCPALFLTARDQVADRVAGLEAGADDYLCKPFAFAEFLAKITGLLRRGIPVSDLRCSDLHIDTVSRSVRRGTETLELTVSEYAMLEFLLRHKNETITRDMLAREVWQITQRATPIDNVIDVHVARLRRKMESDNRPRLLHTVRGIGYCISESEPW